MLKRLLCIAFPCLLLGSCGDDETDGGPCTYVDYPGQCTVTADGTFTYSGQVDGRDLLLRGNTLDDTSLAEGQALECSLRYISSGTCVPCEFDVGACGAEAFQAQP